MKTVKLGGKVTLYDHVKEYLETCPEARDSDMYLYLCFVGDVITLTQDQLIGIRYVLDTVDYNSVSRARRKVVEHNPQLGPSKRVAKLRNEREERATITRGKSITDDRRIPPLESN